MNRLLYAIIAVALLFSCSSETKDAPTTQKESRDTQRAPSGAPQAVAPAVAKRYTLEIFPHAIVRNMDVSLTAKGFKISDAEIQWEVNGIPSQQPGTSTFRTADVMKGSMIQARAIIDGTEVLSNVVPVNNAPPDLSNVSLLPENYRPGDTLTIDAAASDIDGDDITLAYEWRVNDGIVCSERHCAASLKRGDVLSVTVKAFDDDDHSLPVTMKREIVNMPPVFRDQHDTRFEGNMLVSQIKAIDPDGDALQYSLDNKPGGMVIDSSTGLLSWEVPQDFTGIVDASVVVSDGHGGTARYDVKVTID